MDPLSPRERFALRGVLLLALVALALLVSWALLQVVGAFGSVLSLFFYAWLLAFLVDPLATFLVRHIPRLRRSLAVGLVYGGLAILMVVMVLAGAAWLVGAIDTFVAAIPGLIERLPTILDPLEGVLDALGLGAIDLVAPAAGLLTTIGSILSDAGSFVAGLARVAIETFGQVSIILFLALYMSLDSARITRFLGQLVPARLQDEWELLQRSVDRSFGGFVRGQVTVGVLYGACAAGVSLLLGIPLVLLTSVIVAVIHMIPYFGPWVSWLPPVIVALFLAPSAFVPALVLMGVSMILVMNLVQPRVVGDAVGMSPIAVLASVLIGAQVAGIPGAIFGVPVIAVLSVLFLHVVDRLRATGLVDLGPAPATGAGPESEPEPEPTLESPPRPLSLGDRSAVDA